MKTALKEITKEKEAGRVYTPDSIVNCILDLSGYRGPVILKKHIIDNSCGDGAFLRQIVRRYCEAANARGYNIDEIKRDLADFIHGIEIERTEQEKCIANLNQIAGEFEIFDINWDIIHGDALSIKKFDGKMDFVTGNPPYIRVHHLGDQFHQIKKFAFAQNGMTDIFIVFYELGLNMLNQTGVLGYITPSSYFNSVAGAYMRNYLTRENLLAKVIDFKHYQAFSDFTTYTAITILKKEKKDRFMEYYGFDEENQIPYRVENLTPDDYQIDGKYYFAKKEKLNLLRKILLNPGKCDIAVKNGYATLCDGVFIHDFPFESRYIIPVIKSSKGIRQKIFFPYDDHGRLIPEETLRQDKNIYAYLVRHKERLLKRGNEKDAELYWYAFGRGQAIRDTFQNKLAVNALIRSKEDLKFTQAPPGTGVYGGLYLTSATIPMKNIMAALKADEFIDYIALLGKYKSGGYYTFSSKDIKAYLDYKFDYIAL